MIHHPLEIERYMSSVLVIASPQDTLADAARRMQLHEIRHVPIVDRKRVVGVLSDRDVKVVQAQVGSDHVHVLVERVMRTDPYLVEAEESIVTVARTMAQRKVGSAIVAHDGKLLGIFTTTDALRVLATVLGDTLVLPPPHEL